MSVQCGESVAEICLPELLFLLLSQVVACDEAAVGEPVFCQADLDQLGFYAGDVEHQSGVMVMRRSSSSGVGIAARMS